MAEPDDATLGHGQLVREQLALDRRAALHCRCTLLGGARPLTLALVHFARVVLEQQQGLRMRCSGSSSRALIVLQLTRQGFLYGGVPRVADALRHACPFERRIDFLFAEDPWCTRRFFDR